MNYYYHHIGDFDRATRHLTRVERSIYLDLIFVYYDTEAPLTLDITALCRKIMARGPDEREALIAVLAEFFHETPAGWFHDRCEEELEVYRKSKSQASAAGKASAAARAERRAQAMGNSPTGVERRGNENPTTVERPLNDRTTEAQRPVNDAPTNQEPITNNQKPETKEKAEARGSRLPNDWHPSEEDTAFCKAERPELRPSEVAKRFYDYWIAIPGAKGRKLDWPATWRQWVRNERQERRAVERSAPSDKFQVAGLDHTSTNEAMAASMKRHNIVVPDGDIEF